MASKQHIAITRQLAYEALHKSTMAIAEQLGIEAPVLNLHKRYGLEYRQAMELQRMAAFLQTVADSLGVPQQDTRLEALDELVSKRDWTKAQVIALIKGVTNGS